MKETTKRKMRRALLFIFLFLLLAGMTVLSFILLYRYAAYGRTASLNTAGQNPGKDKEPQKTDSKGNLEKSDEEESGRENADPDGNGETGFLRKLSSDQTIRVQLLGDDYLTKQHESLAVTSEEDIIVRRGEERMAIPAGEFLRILWAGDTDTKDAETAEDAPQRETGNETEAGSEEGSDCREIVLAKGEKLLIRTAGGKQPLILSELKRGQENPSYEGKLYVYGTKDGLLVINEIRLEDYLESVVSSEMPSSYPLQALCAQAVCARTYAVGCMNLAREQNMPADLDDSVSYQVYNNYPGDSFSARAVSMTEGLVMNCRSVYYYSTSCLTEGRTDLGCEENFREFLDTPPEEGSEYNSPWIRWSVKIPEKQILASLQTLYHCSWKNLRRAEIQERNQNGQAQSLLLSDGKEEITVEGEYQIRSVLGCAGTKIQLSDGSEAENLQLLPSAFFYIQKDDGLRGQSGGLLLRGGGYGHGIGMSQNGAAAMAQAGAGYEEILRYYYS